LRQLISNFIICKVFRFVAAVIDSLKRPLESKE
jgi:hypothetical protein